MATATDGIPAEGGHRVIAAVQPRSQPS